MKLKSIFVIASLIQLISCQSYQTSMKEASQQKVSASYQLPPDSANLVIVPNREKVRRLNASTMQVGKEIRTLIFESDEKFTINELMDHHIEFRNNKGKLLRIQIRSVIDSIYRQK